MKLSCLTVLLLIGVIAPLINGLRCYECISQDGFEDAPPYNEKCNGGDLPDHLGVDCSVYNLRNHKTLKRLTAEEIALKQNGRNITWKCSKETGKFQGKDLTYKACEFHAYWNEPIPQLDQCKDETFDDGLTVKFCQCFSDLCNGSGFVSGLPIMTMVVSVIAICAINGD